MDGSIVLGSSERKRLLRIYRGKEEHPAQVRLRAHIVLLLADQHPWAQISTMLFCSSATIDRWRTHYLAGGVQVLLEEHRGRTATLLVGWVFWLVGTVKTLTPRDFGYYRSRWCCGTLALVLYQNQGVKVSAARMMGAQAHDPHALVPGEPAGGRGRPLLECIPPDTRAGSSGEHVDLLEHDLVELERGADGREVRTLKGFLRDRESSPVDRQPGADGRRQYRIPIVLRLDVEQLPARHRNNARVDILLA